MNAILGPFRAFHCFMVEALLRSLVLCFSAGALNCLVRRTICCLSRIKSACHMSPLHTLEAL